MIMALTNQINHKILSSQSREIVFNVLQFMRKEAEQKQFVIPPEKVQERVAQATGISIATVKRISKQGANITAGVSTSFETQHNKNRRKTKLDIDSFDEEVLRRIVHTFYETEERIPTIEIILQKFQEATSYKGSKESFRKILQKIGVRWRRVKTHRKLLIESDVPIESTINLEHLEPIIKLEHLEPMIKLEVP